MRRRSLYEPIPSAACLCWDLHPGRGAVRGDGPDRDCIWSLERRGQIARLWRAARLFHCDRGRRSATSANSRQATMMSEEEQRQERQIAEARERDERAARALGEHIPTEQPLHADDERANLWHDIIAFLERVSTSGSEDLASRARALLERVHVL